MLTSSLLLVIPLIIALIAIWLLRSQISTLLARLQRRIQPPVAQTGATIIHPAGEHSIPNAVHAGPRWRARISEAAGNSQVRMAALALVLVVVFLAILGRVMSNASSSEFMVLVAPFQEPDGSISQTGRSAADRLVAALPEATNRRVIAQRIDAPPANEQAALALLRERGADALVWGTISPGSLLDDQSLTPVLAYEPSGGFTPNAWEGYNGRFSMPQVYQLSSTPLNGLVVLPELLGALSDYGLNRPDNAYSALEGLLADYPMLKQTLPRAVLGNILWARGEYGPAADSYQRALETATAEAGQPQAAQLYNNLGVIWQDAGNLTARDAFNKAIELVNGGAPDFGALYYNLGVASMRAGDPVAALAAFEQGYRAEPASMPLLFAMSDAYRFAGQFSDADGDNITVDGVDSALRAINQQLVADLELVPPELRDYHSRRLEAALLREQALAQIMRSSTGRGPVLWNLEATLFNEATLNAIRRDLDEAVDLTEAQIRSWNARAASEDAADRRIAGQIAATQSRRAQQALYEYQRWHAATGVELGELQVERPPQGLGAIWSGTMRDSSAVGQAQKTLEELASLQPRDIELHILLGHALLARGEEQEALAKFNAAANLAPERPEPVYGQALATIQADRAQAKALLLQAIQINSTYFPAHEQLATLAEEDQDWPVAIEQRRQLSELDPSDAATLALARILRLSGPVGYDEAQELLLPLGNNDNVDALVELSQLYTATGNEAAKRNVLEKAQPLASGNAEVAYSLGQLALDDGNLSEAERQFRLALTADRKHIPSLLGMAEVYAATPSSATEYYRQALDAGANNPATLKQIGVRLLEFGQYDLALTAFDRGAKLNDKDPEFQRGIAQANLSLGKLDQAQQAVQRALDLSGGLYPEALVDLGDIALQRQQYDQAIEQYNAALQQDQRLAAAHIGLGKAVAAKDQWSVAAGHFRTAVTADPESPEAHLWLGEALIRDNDANGALAAYQQALALRPAYPEALFGIAQAQIALGQLTDAETNLAEALRLRPKYAEALLLRGSLYEQNGRLRQALTSYEEAIAANGSLPEPRYRRALLLIQNNRFDEARGDLQAALSSRKNYPEAQYWLGRVDFAQGRYREAYEWFKQAVAQTNDSYPEARFYQGLAEEQLGLRDEAILSFQTTLNQDKESTVAGEAQAALLRLNP